ncbi:hypothetical protein M011DRAFT_469095 [Sporormia fimetaria CBS 119925]|uniref:Uncharacterized protein n=1 Tax=Sporormia fimetaria CBS 119925 TaxID=1340428 RepID=A0A6A6V7H9_9PLEO|nr:hypothetical protein M011DRAFT_469095 [Sporormia fimetaria CBS 119925]
MYMLPSNPFVALLPAGSVTREGVDRAVRWMELDRSEDSTAIDATLDQFLEIHQALAFLGNGEKESIMQTLDSHIRTEWEGRLSLAEVKDLWALRHLPFTEPYMSLLLNKLALFCRRTVDLIDKVKAQQKDRVYPELLEQLASDIEILRWVRDDEELFREVDERDRKMQEEATRVPAQKTRRRRRSPFRRRLTVVEEEEDEES